MGSKKILIDTSVWISYFGKVDKNNPGRVKFAKKIIDYCQQEKINLFYCSYVEFELNDNTENIKVMKKIAKKLLAHTGNDTWNQIKEILNGVILKKQH